MNARFQELCDRADILDCMYRYARGMDRLDRELLRSAYHDDAVDDHVGFVGPVDDFVDWAFAYHATQTRHQHLLMNHTADIAGDEAHSETYYVFVGTDRDPDKPLIISGGRYVDHPREGTAVGPSSPGFVWSNGRANQPRCCLPIRSRSSIRSRPSRATLVTIHTTGR